MDYRDGPDFSGEPVLDTVGKEAGNVFRSLLGVATLAALKMRERGQREAEAKVKVTEEKIKEAHELQLREARHAKAVDPRNAELIQSVGQNIGGRVNEAAPKLGNGVPLYRTPEQLAQRALDFAMAPIPRTQTPGRDAMDAMSRAPQAKVPEQTPQELELARRLAAQHRAPEPPIR